MMMMRDLLFVLLDKAKLHLRQIPVDLKRKFDKTVLVIKNSPAWAKENWPAFKAYAGSTRGIVHGSVALIVIFVVVSVVQSCTPRKGTILYGMCRSFLEVQIPFPETIEHTYVEQYRKAIRIYYNHIDPFGEYLNEYIECTFVQNPEKGVQLDTVFFNTVKPVTYKERVPDKGRLYQVDQKYIDLFNISKSPRAILFNEPDLNLPN